MEHSTGGVVGAVNSHCVDIVANSSDAIYSVTSDGTITSWNHAAEVLLGYAAAEVVGRSFLTLVPPDRAGAEACTLSFVKNGSIVSQFETQHIAKDGDAIDLLLTTSPIRDGSGRVVGASRFVEDVRQEQVAQNELQRMQLDMILLYRWNMMGIMSSSLAHELNQPLTAVVNYIRAVSRLLPRDGTAPRIHEYLDQAVEEVKLCGGIIQSMRRFLEKREAVRSQEDINAVVSDALKLSLSARERAIEQKLDPDLPLLWVDKVQIQQVVLNLVRNAAEATADTPGAKITVATARLGTDLVEISVSDNGPGFSRDAKDLFLPFSTAKPNGMGLGLSICRAIVELHGGKIHAENAKPKGAVFRFTLPLLSGAA